MNETKVVQFVEVNEVIKGENGEKDRTLDQYPLDWRGRKKLVKRN